MSNTGPSNERRKSELKRSDTAVPKEATYLESTGGTDRAFKILYGIYATVAYSVVAYSTSKVTLNFLITLATFLVALPWFAMWTHLLAFSPSLYQIQIPCACIDGWTSFSAPQTIELYETHTSISISVLSGVRGTQLFDLMTRTSALVAMLLLIAIHQDLNYRNAQLFVVNSNADMVPICFMMGILGAFNIGFFELTKYDRLHSFLHYAAVGPLLFSSLGIGFITNWSPLAICLTVIETLIATTYFIVCELVPKRHGDIKVVTRSSKICIGIELTSFAVTGIMLLLTINGSGPNQGNIWASFDSFSYPANGACKADA